jgi:hypothetical protein
MVEVIATWFHLHRELHRLQLALAGQSEGAQGARYLQAIRPWQAT